MARFIDTVLLAFTIALPFPTLAQDSHSSHFHRRFDDAERWAKVFDDPAREAWQKPAEVIAALELAPGDAVADIGAGTGYFSVRLARAVPDGRVYALDIEPNMVKHVIARAEKERLPNLSAVLALGEAPRLPAPVDLILMVDTYPDTVRQEMRRAGYALASEHAFLPYQYFLVFRP